MSDTMQMLLRYKAWADEITFGALLNLPDHEVNKVRQTNFSTMTQTLNHVWVVDDIFRHHLTGQPHNYTARNTSDTPPLRDLFEKQRDMNQWYLDLANELDSEELADTIHFSFVRGGEGKMTREQIFLHLVNHATYHRGFVNDMMYQVPAKPPANDLPVFLRETKC
ncbi:MAG: DinB family protein [Pseudoruegeria sp.]